MDVIASLCAKERVKDIPRRTSLLLKLIWAAVVGFAAWIMITLSGIDGIKMLSNLGGFPALFIIGVFNIALIVLGTVKIQALRNIPHSSSE